ncbi:hypothetical protein HAX54_004141 [Datura stramonium]|uniref:Uncharacterized protein n=1 Tax=Datura stramonium TaxID=4076 RepID=A0ABS8WUQ6_DATST|nr:hypothetical protein [Datura stramonium]
MGLFEEGLEAAPDCKAAEGMGLEVGYIDREAYSDSEWDCGKCSSEQLQATGSNGVNPCSWLRKCERYFHYNNIHDEQHKLEPVVPHINGLKDEIKHTVKLLDPLSFSKAVEKARHQEKNNLGTRTTYISASGIEETTCLRQGRYKSGRGGRRGNAGMQLALLKKTEAMPIRVIAANGSQILSFYTCLNFK